jgi:hypothetical protein
MNGAFDRQLEPRFESQVEDSEMFARSAMDSMSTAARAGVVNRTHRVVRERAIVMQARRSYVRSLMVPLILCAVILALAAAAVWSGLYQYEAAEAAQDVASLASADANDHLLVALWWFVPVSLVLLVAIWVRHARSGSNGTAQ